MKQKQNGMRPRRSSKVSSDSISDLEKDVLRR